jgi:hypothetical protein
MARSFSDGVLDQVLAVQLAVAWAGEGRCQPKRLGWWDTDLIDEEGGGDFFARLLPHTHRWASLEAVREAARRVDARARGKMADPDAVRTLFFMGFELDEQLADRLAFHKRDGKPPSDALPWPLPPSSRFSRDELANALGKTREKATVVPAGRQLKGPAPAEPDTLVKRLAAGLLPFTDHYPLPHFRVGA